MLDRYIDKLHDMCRIDIFHVCRKARLQAIDGTWQLQCRLSLLPLLPPSHFRVCAALYLAHHRPAHAYDLRALNSSKSLMRGTQPTTAGQTGLSETIYFGQYPRTSGRSFEFK